MFGLGWLGLGFILTFGEERDNLGFLNNVLVFLFLQLFLFLLGCCCYVTFIYFAAIPVHFLAQNLSSSNSGGCLEEIYYVISKSTPQCVLKYSLWGPAQIAFKSVLQILAKTHR